MGGGIHPPPFVDGPMEKKIRIALDARHALYGKFSGSSSRPLVIFVHGLLGTMDDDLFVVALRWFRGRNYAVFRFNLYGHQKYARQLKDCTLSIHAADLDAAVRHFRKKGFRKILVVGHSFGGPVIFNSRERDFDGAAFWDPSYRFSFKKIPGVDAPRFVKSENAYLMRWGMNPLIGKKMVDEVESLRWDALSKNFSVPFSVIVAGKGILKGAKKYCRAASTSCESIGIRGADHCFTSDRSRSRLFSATARWFARLC
jgi:alpha-beta hydrolase superfamily lysophospholipase